METKTITKPKCKVCLFLENFEDKETAEIVKKGLSTKIGSQPLAKIFSSHQLGLGKISIEKHRKEKTNG